MKNLLLGIIAINLIFLSIITTLNYMQPANAKAARGIQKVAICDLYYGDCANIVVNDGRCPDLLVSENYLNMYKDKKQTKDVKIFLKSVSLIMDLGLGFN